jgi:large subunit ribosomal protein L17
MAGYKLTRDSEHRIALRRNLAIALFTHGQITTTLQKAKSVQPMVEKIITLAKKGDLASRRRVIAQIGDPIAVKSEKDEDVTRNKYGEVIGGPKLVKRIFTDLAPKYADRAGGCTRIIKLGTHRIGDAADLVVLQLVGDEEGPQVAGRFSRRREKANKRMEFAAKIRKGKSEAAESPAADAAAPESDTSGGDTAVATEEAPKAE